MPTLEIRRDEWIRFFDSFSMAHQGWIATLEVVGWELGEQDESRRLPLVGISADVKDRESRITVILSRHTEDHLTRIVEHAERVWLERPSDVTRGEAIAVESEDGSTTLVYFQRVPPERAERQLPRPVDRGT